MPRLDTFHPFKSVLIRTKVFFRRQKWKETLIFLLFVLLSAGFWYLQSLQEDAELKIVLPVKYRNIPSNMTLAEDNPTSVTFKVKDKGLVLLGYSWLNKFAPIEVNPKGIRDESDGRFTVSGKIIESAMARQLMSSSVLTGIDPQTIEVRYGILQYRDIPVVAEVSIWPEPGFQVSDSVKISPASVRVYASSNIVDSLQVLKTEPAELKKVTETKELTLRLQKIPGVHMDTDEVKVTVPVEEFTEKRLSIPVLCDDLPEKYKLYAFPSSVEVVCNVPLSRFKGLTEADFEIRIPFFEFDANRATGKLSVYLNRQPAWLVRPTLNPDIIEFILEQNAIP